MVLTESIQFDAVSFTYEADPGVVTEPALYDICLEIRRGESIGIVGPTGSGKTTLVDLMLGLLEPTSGSSARLAAADRLRPAERVLD